MGARIVTIKTPGVLCDGGKPFPQCETAQAMIKGSQGDRVGVEGYDHPIWSNLRYLTRVCVDCGSECSIELESINSERTGNARFTFIKEEPGDIPHATELGHGLDH